MKRYMLLRKNQESGPYTLEELSVRKLRPMDLLWKEGESTCWRYAEEIDELKELVDHDTGEEVVETEDAGVQRAEYTRPHVDPLLSHATNTFDLQKRQAEIARQFRERYPRPRKAKGLWEKQTFEERSLTNLAFVFIGVILGSFVMKKIVDNIDDTSLLGTTEATFVMSHPQVPKVSDPNIQNAISREFIPARDTTKKVEAKPMKPNEVRKLVKVNGSNYKVGILGGIRGLELNVYNGSTELVDRVIVEVQYQNTKGELVDVRNFTAQTIRPFHSKTISVPPNERGVKVDYKILNISLKGHKRPFKEA